MSSLEAIFFWVAVVLYGIVTGLYVYSFVFRNERILNRIHYFIGAPFLFHTAAIIARYIAVGNLPSGGNYENSIGTSWFVILMTLYAAARHKQMRAVGLGTVPVSLLMLGYGVMSGPELAPMAASVKSIWLYVHVYFAWLAFGAFAVALGLGIMYLLKEKNPAGDFYGKLPDLPRLDDLIFKYLVFGFITDTVMIASGAIWAKDLWGNYWSWDPVEAWSLITWAVYGLSIHLRVTMGWKGKRMAWIAIFAFSGMIITFFFIDALVETTLHAFDAWKTM